MADLRDLLERVRKAEGPDRELDAEIACALDGWEVEVGVPDYTASIDASVALVERVLGRHWQYDLRRGRGVECRCILLMVEDKARPPKGFSGYHLTMPLAILAGLLKAKIRESGNG